MGSANGKVRANPLNFRTKICLRTALAAAAVCWSRVRGATVTLRNRCCAPSGLHRLHLKAHRTATRAGRALRRYPIPCRCGVTTPVWTSGSQTFCRMPRDLHRGRHSAERVCACRLFWRVYISCLRARSVPTAVGPFFWALVAHPVFAAIVAACICGRASITLTNLPRGN